MALALPALTTRRLLAVLLVVALFALAAQPALDPDLWWHLRTGQWVMENRAVPLTDPFSFTKNGEHWVAHEWLADVGLFLLYQVGGLNALTLVTAIIVTLTFTIVYRLSVLRPRLAVFTTLLAALASAAAWGPRPQMLTLLFVALTLLSLARARNHSARWLWLLPPLFVLWANVHSGFFLGLVIIAVTLVGEITERLIARWHTGSAHQQAHAHDLIKPLTITLVLSTLACTLNPHGAELLVYPFFTLMSKAMQTYIVEWHSPDFHDPRFAPFVALWFLLFLSFALSRRRPSSTELLLLLGLGYESLVSVRNIPLFAIVAAPVITRQIQCAWDAKLQANFFDESRRSNSRMILVVNWVLLIAITFITMIRVAVILPSGAAQAAQFPVEAADYLLTAKPAGPLLNSYNFGGYLVWRLYPTYRVFIDGRADVYGDAFMDDYYAHAWHARGDWQSYLDRYNIKLVLMETDSVLSSLLRTQPQWRVVHEDQVAVIFQRVPS